MRKRLSAEPLIVVSGRQVRSYADQVPTRDELVVPRWTPIGGRVETDGIIRQRFRKELMAVGHYEKEDGTEYEITLDELNHWVDVSGEMHANGVRIPLLASPEPHTDVGNPDNAIGTMEDAFVEGDTLVVILEIVGEDAIENALQNDVSIYSPPEFKDGTGRVYKRPITHVAITPNPLVPGLADWQRIAIAASLGTGKEKSMWKKLAKLLGMSAEDMEDLSDDNGMSKISAAIKALKDAHKTELKEAKKGNVKATLEDEDVKTEIKTEVDKQVTEIKASLGKPKEVDQLVVGLMVDNRRMRLDSLISAARLTPHSRKKIDVRYGEKDAISASMKIGENGDVFDFWTDVFAGNDCIELAEKTGAQVIAATLNKPGDKVSDENNPLLKDAARRVEAAKR